MLNEVIIGLTIANMMMLVVSMIFMIKMRRFESEKAKTVLNLLVSGMAFYLLLLIADVLWYLGFFGVYEISWHGIIRNTAVLVMGPLVAMCILASVFVIRES